MRRYLAIVLITLTLTGCASTSTGALPTSTEVLMSTQPPSENLVPAVEARPTVGSRPANLDLSTDKLSDQGSYHVSFTSETQPIPMNQIHQWTLHVETADGQPVENAAITVGGGMPEHGHGLPTVPQVTEYLGDGNYQVQGMKFQMGGWWVVTFSIDDGMHQDSVTFNILL